MRGLWFGVVIALMSVSARADVRIEYIAHASFKVHTAAGQSLLIDPFADRIWIGLTFPKDEETLDVDLVLITHPHFDHDMGRFFGIPLPWNDEMPILDKPGTTRFGDITIRGVKGMHAGPYGVEFNQVNTMFKIEADGLSIIHLGDNRPLTDDEISNLGTTDILMIPVDDQEHLTTFEVVQHAISALDPKIVMPMHYRHAELEPNPLEPEDLGGISGWLSRQSGVVRFDTNEVNLSEDTLPEGREIWVLSPSPKIPRVR